MIPGASLFQQHGPKILGIDGAHIKNKNYNGNMFLLVSCDGDSNNVVPAVALCDGESAANYAWFFACCEKGGLSVTRLPAFSDRGSGIISAAGGTDILLVH